MSDSAIRRRCAVPPRPARGTMPGGHGLAMPLDDLPYTMVAMVSRSPDERYGVDRRYPSAARRRCRGGRGFGVAKSPSSNSSSSCGAGGGFFRFAVVLAWLAHFFLPNPPMLASL
mgnify:CR=1